MFSNLNFVMYFLNNFCFDEEEIVRILKCLQICFLAVSGLTKTVYTNVFLHMLVIFPYLQNDCMLGKNGPWELKWLDYKILWIKNLGVWFQSICS